MPKDFTTAQIDAITRQGLTCVAEGLYVQVRGTSRPGCCTRILFVAMASWDLCDDDKSDGRQDAKSAKSIRGIIERGVQSV